MQFVSFGQYNLRWSAPVTWDGNGAPETLLLGFSASFGGWFRFAGANQTDTRTILCQFAHNTADVSEVVQLGPLTHITTALPWVYASPDTTIPAPVIPSAIIAAFHTPAGEDHVIFNTAVTPIGGPAHDPHILLWSPSQQRWIIAQYINQTTPVNIHYADPVGDINKVVMVGIPQNISAPSGFTPAAPITTIP